MIRERGEQALGSLIGRRWELEKKTARRSAKDSTDLPMRFASLCSWWNQRTHAFEPLARGVGEIEKRGERGGGSRRVAEVGRLTIR